MNRRIKYEQCQRNHKTHRTQEVYTVLGKMTVYQWDLYKDKPLYCPGQDDISRTLINTGIWEKDLYSFVQNLLKAGNKDHLVIDIGCHIGWYSRMAIQAGYTVDAYDGCQSHLDVFIKNVPGTIPHHVQFDKYLTDKYPIRKPIEFVKIDIEGAEQYAIKYLTVALRNVHNILMEVSPVFNDSYPELLRNLKNRGFTILETNGKVFDFNFNFPQRDLWLVNKLW